MWRRDHIESRFVLTAAHCITSYWPDGRDFVVVVGEYEGSKKGKAEGSKAQILKVEKFVTHPNFRSMEPPIIFI